MMDPLRKLALEILGAAYCLGLAAAVFAMVRELRK
jgi:hypothetical protein